MTKEDYNNVLVFLNRVQVSGGEAMTLVMLQQKLIQLRDKVDIKDETKTKTTPQK